MRTSRTVFRTGGMVLALAMAGCGLQPPDYVTMISPDQLKGLMQKQDIFLVDVHTPEQRHIKGTDAFIPFDQVEKYTSQLPQDKSAPIYLYCESGRMANTAAATLHQMGYAHLSNLEGGAKAWRAAGFDLQ